MYGNGAGIIIIKNPMLPTEFSEGVVLQRKAEYAVLQLEEKVIQVMQLMILVFD